MKKKIFIVMLILGFVIFINLVYKNTLYQSKLIRITFENNLNLEVKSAYNERGIYILNDQYYLNSATYIIEENTLKVNDDAIWRPEGSKYIPRISDVKAPFTISKNKNSDTICIERDDSKIFLLLSN